jgi:hypothetical protein
VIKGALAALAGGRTATGRMSVPAAQTAAIVAGACLCVTLAACSSPTKPSVSVASATPFSPANGEQIPYNTQPVKLLANNAVTTGGVSLSEMLDVATDAAFATLVVSKGVPQSAGQTSLILDPLPPATYYWRVRAAASDATVTSPTFTFKVVLPAPVLVSPANAAQVEYHTQPLKLLVDNGASTGGVLVSDMFEVATDAAFTTLVVSKSLPQSAGGQTSLMLDPLPAGTYSWRVRAAAGDTTVTSPTFTFNIAVALPPPVLVFPASAMLIGHLNQPITLIVQNPVPSPPVSGITNSFDVATDSAFADMVVSKSTPQRVNGPTTLVLDPLPPNTMYYWRVRSAASGAIGAVSATASFRIGPALVSGSYRLTIDTLLNFYPGCQPGSGTQFTFDGNLMLTTQTLVFTLPRASNPVATFNDLVLRLTLAADRVSGSIISNQSHPSSFAPSSGLPFVVVLISKSIAITSIFYAPGDATPVDTAGSVSTNGRVTGAFDGYLAAEYINPMFRCTGHFIWSLAPR